MGNHSEAVVRVDRLAAGGEGVARLDDGRALFIPLTAPGDQVRVRIIEERKRFARGEMIELRVLASVYLGLKRAEAARSVLRPGN